MSDVQVITSPESYIVIDDGMFRYPVARADVEASGKSKADLRAMDGDAYSAWCRDLPRLGVGIAEEVGTAECIDFCERLIAAGAERWDIA
jgi:hypothetical protein